MSTDSRCPCGSGRSYSDCCGPLHADDAAETAIQLMRSRFAAFALNDERHLLATWHPCTRPPGVDLDDGTVWRRLQIVDSAAGGPDDDGGIVEFRASFRTVAGSGVLHERSRFTRSDGRWVYLDGQVLGPA